MTKEPNRNGKKPFLKLEERDYEIVHNCVKIGVRQDNIARILGMCPDSFNKLKKRDERLNDIVEAARAEGEKTAASIVWNIMNDPSHKQRLTAAMFYLKTQHRWREVSVVETKQPDLPDAIEYAVKTDEN